MSSIWTKQPVNDSLELTNLSQRVRTKSIVENRDDFEECILVWLDSTINIPEKWTKELKYARGIINKLKIFDNPTDCITFIKSIVEDKIFLFLSQ